MGDNHAAMNPERIRVLLLTPPMVQFNAPYAATPMLTAFLRREGIDARQADLSLELALRLFSQPGLEELRRTIRRSRRRRTATVRWFLKNAGRYLETVDEVVRYLQCGDPETAAWFARRTLPEGPRFRVLRDLAAAGRDPAGDPTLYPRLLASLYLDDLADVVREGADPRFGLSRYAERLAAAAPSFTPIRNALRRKPTMLDRMLDELTTRLLDRVQPDLVAVTIPFPGNVYAAFRIAKRVKDRDPRVRTVAGGGFVNTELRSVTDPRVFDFFDYLTVDDGELPLLRIARHLAGKLPQTALVRTRLRVDNKVLAVDADPAPLRHRKRPAPCYDGLPLDRYCAMAETPNPAMRLWTERRWMKLALAHGCYWHRCAFCDTGLDYIRRYDPADAGTIVDWIAEVQQRTGERGFHFVDEAAPPALLRRVARELIERKLNIAWWTNVRFDKSFTPELTLLLARSGCVAVTGGLECAERRLLAAMEKGISLPEATRVTHAFAQAGILVHAYLMYGFPRQTVQETVDALEFVRQLFHAGCLQSAYWHRFALTVHSPIFRAPARFGVRPRPEPDTPFARNEIPFTDGTRTDHEALGESLHKAVYNYMHGTALDADVRSWFGRRTPAPRLAPTAVAGWIRKGRGRKGA